MLQLTLPQVIVPLGGSHKLDSLSSDDDAHVLRHQAASLC